MRWTDERVERLKALWLRKLPASEIARDLGGVTRNGVIGKAHRLNLEARALPTKPPGPYKPREATSRDKPRTRAVKPTFAAPPPPRRAPGPVSHHLCQWPMNEWPEGMAHLAVFCHETTQEGSSYCCAHHAKAWVKPIKAGNIPTIDWTVKRRAA